MKNLFVNKDACIGCGACVAIDSEHFDFGEDNLSEVISQENIESESAQNAIASCPTNAISYVETVKENEEETEEEHCCGKCEGKDCCHKHDDEDFDEGLEAA